MVRGKGLQQMITYRSNKCAYCNKTISHDTLFCKQCQIPKMEYLDVCIAASWSKYIDSRKTETEKVEELVKYSERHGYRFDLVRLKLFRKFNIMVEVSKNDLYLLPDLSGGFDEAD